MTDKDNLTPIDKADISNVVNDMDVSKKVINVADVTKNNSNKSNNASNKTSIIPVVNSQNKTATPGSFATNDASSYSGGIVGNPNEGLPAPNKGIGIGKSLNVSNKLYNIEKSIINVTARTIANMAEGGNETGKGLSMTTEVTSIGKIVATSTYIRMQNFAFNGELRKKFGIFDKEDFKKSIDEVNELLRKYNCPTLNREFTGPRLRSQALLILRQLKRKNINIPELNEALKKMAKLGFLTSKKRFGFRRLRMKCTGYVTKNLKKCEAGNGLTLTVTIISRGKSAIKMGIKTAQMTARSARIIAQKAMLMAAKAALATARKTQLAYTQTGQKIGNATKKVQKTVKKGSKKVSDATKKAKKMAKDPFGIKKKAKSFVNKLLFRNPLANKLRSNIVVRTLGSALAIPFKLAKIVYMFFAEAIKFVLIIALLICIIMFIVAVVISAITNMFNANSLNDDLKKDVTTRMQQCYESDLKYISSMSSKYPEGITIKYEDVKNQKKYDELDKKEPFYQTTNCAEIISMAMTRYDFDMDNIDKKEVLTYVEQLYHGTHEIIVKETTSTDKDGNTVTSSATITYRTYYFDYMFDRALSDSTITNSYNSNDISYISEDAIKDDMYVAIREHGYTHEAACAILANVQAESNFNPKSENSSGYYGLFQWGGGRKTNLMKYCQEKGYTYFSAEGQMAFFFYEIENSYKSLSDYLKTANDINMATQEFCVGYEGCVGSTKTDGDGVYSGSLYPSAVGKTYQLLNTRINNGNSHNAIYVAYKEDFSQLKGSLGQQIAKLGLTYVGKLHYAWGGRNLNTGADCSGFVYALYQKFDITIPIGSASIISDDKHKVLSKLELDKMQPGDIVVEKSGASGSGRHVTIYVGNGQFIGSNGNNSGCPQAGASPGGTALENQICPNDCGYTTPQQVIGVYRYVK